MSKWNSLINKYNPEDTDLCDLLDEAEKIGRADAIEELIDIVSELESCCIDHEENEIGEWLTFTFDYEKWADMLHKWEQLKEQKNE